MSVVVLQNHLYFTLLDNVEAIADLTLPDDDVPRSIVGAEHTLGALYVQLRDVAREDEIQRPV